MGEIPWKKKTTVGFKTRGWDEIQIKFCNPFQIQRWKKFPELHLAQSMKVEAVACIFFIAAYLNLEECAYAAAAETNSAFPWNDPDVQTTEV